MRQYLGLVAAAALAIGGINLMGCQHNDGNDRTADNGGMTGGGSTDTYGTDANSRYRGGNMGTDTGSGTTGSGATTGNAGTYNGTGGNAPTGNAGGADGPAPGNGGGTGTGGSGGTGGGTGR